MAQRALSRHVEGIGEGSVVGAFSKLLQLSCEAVVVFDGAGRILLANDEASELFPASTPLVGADVRLLFPSVDADAALGPFSASALPSHPASRAKWYTPSFLPRLLACW